MKCPLAYVAGKYSAHSIEQRDKNIAAADLIGRALVAKGYAAIVPHNNTTAWEFDGRFTHETFMRLDLTILERCDLLVTVDDWKESVGAQREVLWAKDNGIPVYHSLSEVPDVESFQFDCTSELIGQLYARRRLGVERYGVPLRPHNGRDAQRDSKEEALDLVLYMTQVEMEDG